VAAVAGGSSVTASVAAVVSAFEEELASLLDEQPAAAQTISADRIIDIIFFMFKTSFFHIIYQTGAVYKQGKVDFFKHSEKISSGCCAALHKSFRIIPINNIEILKKI
jgi:hypothetical protein